MPPSIPNTADQYRYLQNSRATELRELEGHDEGAIARQIQAEEMQLGALALERDMDAHGEMISSWPRCAAERRKLALKTEETPALTNPLAACADSHSRLAKGPRPSNAWPAARRPPPPRAGPAGKAPRGALTIEDGLKLNGAAFDSWVKVRLQAELANGNWN